MAKLGVNIDHVATLRQARREFDPNPIKAAKIAVRHGADSIVCHLREDRRHIQDDDVRRLRRMIKRPLNLEMAIDPQIVAIARKIKPDYAMLVPEHRQEVTTEGGLDVIKKFSRVKQAVLRLADTGIRVSVFVDPKMNQIQRAKDAGAQIVELHTGRYANARTLKSRARHLEQLKKSAAFARKIGLSVHAGHGLKYHNARAVARIRDIEELNIGHAIISEAVFTGLPAAVQRMKKIVS